MTKSRKSKNTADSPPYVGRFAPSPTGPLHFGSLICALASYLDARSHNGRWLMRMEDLDPPRESPGAASAILHSLEAHGLEWDGEVLWQSQRHDAYADTVRELLADGRAFYCNCSRAQLAQAGGVYPGTCRNRQPDSNDAAVRVRVVDNSSIEITDQCQSALRQNIAREVGDFIIQRRDGLYAYQLAVVIDDAFQGISQVVRGCDLYDSTPRQVYLQQQLSLPTPVYTHIPVVTHSDGQKLSKQSHAPAVEDDNACDNLRRALRFIGQPAVDDAIDEASILLQQATAQWQLASVPGQAAIPESSLG